MPDGRRRCLALLALMAALPAAAWANARPPIAGYLPDGDRFRVLGQGRMRWFGLTLYDAALWVAGDRWQWERPFALELRYARDFEGRRLAAASVDEMRRIGFDDARRLAAWREAMLEAFPDVRKGETITGVYHPGEGAEFFHQGRRTAAIRDPEFARAFFSIWLDPRTREPKLRAALLGIE